MLTGILFAMAVLFVLLRALWPNVVAYRAFSNQMRVGKLYMDSLSPQDIQQWIARTQAILSAAPVNGLSAYGAGEKPIPEDLKKLKIIRIDVLSPERVDYEWCGGMDHTGPIINREDDGHFTVTAEYDDLNTKVLWPKQLFPPKNYTRNRTDSR